jgi:hypothetical protein
MNNKLVVPSILLAIIAITMVMAPTMSAYSQEEVKKPKTPKDKSIEICDPKVNVKALGESILNGTEYTATLAGVTQTKAAEEDGTVNFHFDFKAKKPKVPQEAKPSGKGTCFITGTTLSGDVEGTAFDANINKKTTKVQVTLTNSTQ